MMMKISGTRNGGCHAFLMHLRILCRNANKNKKNKKVYTEKKRRMVQLFFILINEDPYTDLG
jgi:hypothetical protein